MSAPPPPGPYDPNQGGPVPPPGQQPPPPQPGQPHPGQYGPPGAGAPQQPGQQPPAGVPQPGMGPGGGQPPGQFPPGQFPPGGPGGPGGQPPGRNRKPLLIGGAIGAAVLLIATIGVVVYMVAESRPYAAMPDHCDEIFSEDLFEEIADGESITVEGEYDDSEDTYDYGYLSCSVVFGDEEDQSYDHSVGISMEIHEPESSDLEEQVEEMQEMLEDLEAELPPGEPGTAENEELGLGGEDEIMWERSSQGDDGVFVSFVPQDSGTPQVSSVGYLDVNAFVGVNVTTPEDSFDWEETAAMTESLAGDVSRAISSAAERM